MEENIHILLGVTGSVAAIKGPEIAVRLLEDLVGIHGSNNLVVVKVKVLLTTAGHEFWKKSAEYDPTSWVRMTKIQQRKPSLIEVYENVDEWKEWRQLGDNVLHISLRDWADIFLIAPLSANTLSKVAAGLCDDTLSCVARAWSFHQQGDSKCDDIRTILSPRKRLVTRFGHKPLILAPAMNTAMWNHPLTQQQLEKIKSFSSTSKSVENDVKVNTSEKYSCGVVVIPPQSKQLACGDIGDGALAPVGTILDFVRDSLQFRPL